MISKSVFLLSSDCLFSFQLVFRILDGFNMLRGLFIFLVFFWKSSMMKKIEKRHPKFAKSLFCIYKLLCRKRHDVDSFDNSAILPYVNSNVLIVNNVAKIESDNVECKCVKNSLHVMETRV